jgi:4-amino-4-deoxy-L-arabinose transferase-like glycosyltransferase
MNEWRRFGGLEWLLVAVVLAVAAGARCGYLHICAQDGATAGPLQVQDPPDEGWAELVDNLSRDAGFGRRPAEGQPVVSMARPAPLYPGLVAGVRRISPDMPSAERRTRWLQCGLGTLTALLLFLFARQAFQSNLVGTIAGLTAALHPFWIVNAAEIADGVLATLLLTAALYLGARAHRLHGALTSWVFGLALAGLALTRAALLLFAVLALLWFLQRCTQLERGWMLALLSFLGFASGFGPWMVRNYLVLHEVYPVVDSAMYDFWLGNGPRIMDETHPDPGNDVERLREVWQQARLRPSAVLHRRLQAGLEFLLGGAWFDHEQLCTRQGDAEQWSSVPDWLSRSYGSLLAGSLLILFLLGGLGWRVTYPWRREAMPLALALVFIPLPYLLGHAETLSGPRLPWDGVLICYAAYALVWVLMSAAHVVFGREFGVDVER